MSAVAAGISAAASTRAIAIGAPPPRGVGTVCDDRWLGVSIAATRRSSGIVTGSAAATKPALRMAAAAAVARCPCTELDTTDLNHSAWHFEYVTLKKWLRPRP